MTSRHSARSLFVAFGLLGSAIVSTAQTATDPIQRPLWQFEIQQAMALDSLPARTNRYQLLSFPVDPSPATVSSIFDELGGYNTQVYRIGHWVPTRTGSDKYVEANNSTAMVHGEGFWLITRDSVKVRYNGNAAPADTFELPLLQAPNGAAEWNQLGNPFTFNSAVANWRVVKRDSLLTLGQAASRTWIDANMRTWNPSTQAYTASGTIPRGAGFWTRLVDPDTALQWTRWMVDSVGSLPGMWSSVKLDSKGNPHIAYYVDGNPGQFRYATRKNNTWTVTTLDQTSGTFNGPWASIDIDSLDNPHIAYTALGSASFGRLMYIRRQVGGGFTIPEQIAAANNGFNVKLKLWHGIPRVAYLSYDDNTLRYAEKNIGGWVVETASALAAGNRNIFDGDIGFDVDRLTGRPHIASPSTNSPSGLRYVTKIGANWTSELVDSLGTGETGIAPSLSLDAAGNPHIAYFDRENVDLRYARKSGSSWTLETVDATGNTGNYSEIMIRPSGQPVIAFLEFASMGVVDRIRFAQRSGGGWQIETVDDVRVSSFFAFMGATLDPSGQPRISYQGRGVSNAPQLRYAEKIRGAWRIKIPPVAAPEPAAATEKPSDAVWAVSITARQDGRAAEPLYLGVAGDEAIAALRSGKAPAPPSGGMLSLSVPRGTEEFVRDFQTSAETVRWSFRTDGGITPGEQTLDFAGFDLPADMKLFLTDSENGWTREVHAGESVTLAARPRTLELVATTSEGPATTAFRNGLSFAYPNPFGRNTGLAFTLAQRGDLRVDLFDVSGRRVRTLERAGAPAGEHVLTWDGRDASGRLLPSGIYMAAWRAGDASGSRRLVKVE